MAHFPKITMKHFHLGSGYDIKNRGDVYNEMITRLSSNRFGGNGNG
ncbi:hypothetical protein PAJ34TS1_43150 [Paenibacillus azoreducens]|uniref:Uncharacterized protein n=1 Tax=Paenibacillus azoreducens TaxID=116718 RepID=A0A919YEN3_9BACL|nr:hypothetical protein J34TS1_45670 [Paenibacillus azoreducens]